MASTNFLVDQQVPSRLFAFISGYIDSKYTFLLLLNIFLGLLGTFWFRTQQRRGEIALHKAMGATDGAVFGRLMSEGMFLLLILFMATNFGSWLFGHIGGNVMQALGVPFEQLGRGMSGFFFWK